MGLHEMLLGFFAEYGRHSNANDGGGSDNDSTIPYAPRKHALPMELQTPMLQHVSPWNSSAGS